MDQPATVPDLRADATAWRRLLERASAPYRASGRFAWHFARGKLRGDPVFRHLLAAGLIAPQARVLDLGCGQGLLASLLRACSQMRAAGEWPASWPPAPTGARVAGIDLLARDIQRARTALGSGEKDGSGDASFVCADLRRTPFPAADTVVLLDVLHYMDHVEQEAVLRRVCDALPASGRLLLRVGDARRGGRFRASQWVDTLVAWLRGHGLSPAHGRALDEWIAQLRSLGLAVQARPLSEGTPFANVLLVAQRA
ncbi:MAG TPA: class I SAM-dependent methyltransferase [Ramlibacter sp.]|jgi:SAM-dependent methyltransferase|uniref:class I SAM-dependent methyltransferase n=1 Tax=Ramlibacter sp. TaxID=1917967 RepID=UPI002D29AB9F|nr:class I SAM-dependent methyltransferase [Ramlibacter sp.]HZY19967.1 class I SAM-dependent methyltransferase [Ramlibacter sp.]